MLEYFIFGFLISVCITPLFRKVGFMFGLLDIPTGGRKIHTKPMPLTGGLAVFFSYSLAVAGYLWMGDVNFQLIPLKFFLSLFFGGAILILGGVLDDKYSMPPLVQLLFPAFAALIVMYLGVGVGLKEISNPFGTPFNLRVTFLFIPIAYYLVFFWLMGMMFTTKLLDGLDGLTSGIGGIAATALFFLSLTPKVNQPETAILALLFCGVLFGYLVFAFHPASIFLGQGGSLYVGFVLGVLSVILGGKILTALLVMGMPILDVVWAILRRIMQGKNPFVGDRRHLHHRLLDAGLPHWQAVLVFYAVSAIFGFSAVFMQTKGKIFLALTLVVMVIGLGITSVLMYIRRKDS
ncbi:MAG TPA: MraY family glycosyltransferase [Patescibacteria group bacterium]|nr:MraY family glycosyltransferase [Patescibacteria group bacterium]